MLLQKDLSLRKRAANCRVRGDLKKEARSFSSRVYFETRVAYRRISRSLFSFRESGKNSIPSPRSDPRKVIVSSICIVAVRFDIILTQAMTETYMTRHNIEQE